MSIIYTITQLFQRSINNDNGNENVVDDDDDDNNNNKRTGTQVVEALRYKSEGRGFDSRWCN